MEQAAKPDMIFSPTPRGPEHEHDAINTFKVVGEIVKIMQTERQSAWQGSMISKASCCQGVACIQGERKRQKDERRGQKENKKGDDRC